MYTLTNQYLSVLSSSFTGQISSGMSNPRIDLLLIKSLHEVQKSDIMKLAADNVSGGGEYILKHMDILPLDCTALFQFLRHVKNLLELNNGGNCIGENGALEVAGFLKEGKRTGLNLSTCWINKEGAEHLSDALKNENCKLTSLNLSNNITDEGVEHLSDALKNENCKLTSLHLCGNEINNKGVEHLSDALKNENCKLTSLHFFNDITDGPEHLSDALKNENCKLTSLNLSNNITDEGVEHLSDALKNENCKLKRLRIRNTKISNEGAEHLRCVSRNCEITI